MNKTNSFFESACSLGAEEDAEAAHGSGYNSFARNEGGSDEASTSYPSDDADGNFRSTAPHNRARGLWQALRGLLHVGHDAEGAVCSPLRRPRVFARVSAIGCARPLLQTLCGFSHLSPQRRWLGAQKCLMPKRED